MAGLLLVEKHFYFLKLLFVVKVSFTNKKFIKREKKKKRMLCPQCSGDLSFLCSVDRGREATMKNFFSFPDLYNHLLTAFAL